ncbi:DUF3833 domain-containing protein [Catenovulum adriaticum]|uniref:DUF3833 domain-containing protein n=1 Tax=Catenovulum adriaticum TaxID=2984846 RepID=A0ABY7AKF6_9ALTE|nr:DUF3833 domain-containing protein [Catenovulum sp. TS8]WAJ70033.1 DUF3833 domain-containing protein [Catenovulum sp. TS8]
MHYFKIFILCLNCFWLNACSTHVSDYTNSSPDFKLEHYFNGNIKAWGILQNYSGKVSRRFTVDIKAKWDGNQGELKEYFEFDDGEKQTRIWTLTKIANGVYEGQANDVIGTAQIKQVGMAVNLQYQLSVPVDGDSYIFTIDDWMYQIDDKRVFNKSTLSKLGVEVAQLTIFFEKQ